MNEHPEEQKEKKKRGTIANLTQAGKGRMPGIPNKATTNFRQTVTQLLADNSTNVGVWLERVSKNDPAKALDLLAKLAEYAAPKLSKVEVSAEVEVTHGYAFRIERPNRERVINGSDGLVSSEAEDRIEIGHNQAENVINLVNQDNVKTQVTDI